MPVSVNPTPPSASATAPAAGQPALSLVLPIFNEEPVIGELGTRLASFLAELDLAWEVIFVDDGSRDRSFELLKDLCAGEPRYRLVSFSRNFGHQLAITAGIDYARGAAVVVMDADLQDPPEAIALMVEKWRAGFDIVHAVRRQREREGLFKRGTAFIFYRLLRKMVGFPIPLDAGDFRLMSRRVVLTLRALREANPFVRGMVAWVGFRQATIEYSRKPRFAGETHYPLRKMVRFALDGITSFSAVPLRLAIWLGLAAGAAGVVVAAWAVYERLIEHVVPGWATIMIAVSLASSVQLVMIGVLGEYVGRIYEELKRRPLYIVAEEVNAKRDDERDVPDVKSA
jgi:glycosyltransferase involved in cell wall biosynthesis